MSVFPAGAVASARRAPVESGDPLARLADLARALVRRASLRFAVASTDAERDAIFRLRHRVVRERGWAIPEHLADGREIDPWDEGAILAGGWHDGGLVACARLIVPTPGHELPVETVFDLSVRPPQRVVHVDRLIVAREAGGQAHRTLLGLVAFCWLEAHARRRHLWTGIDSRLTLRLYRAIGFDVEVIGPGRRYWSEERFPVRFDTAAAAEAIVARWSSAVAADHDAPEPPR